VSEAASVYSDYLSGEGYRPEIDSDGDVAFKSEGKSYYIDIDTDDRSFFQLVYPNFWPIEDNEELLKAVFAADAANRKTKVAKVYLRSDHKQVSAAIEIFLPKPEEFGEIFPRALNALRASVSNFVEEMK
jgi:hypothetical protein